MYTYQRNVCKLANQLIKQGLKKSQAFSLAHQLTKKPTAFLEIIFAKKETGEERVYTFELSTLRKNKSGNFLFVNIEDQGYRSAIPERVVSILPKYLQDTPELKEFKSLRAA